MKKLFVVLTIFFASISSSFAYQHTISTSGYWNGALVNINSYCSMMNFSVSFNDPEKDGQGGAVAYGSNPSGGTGLLIGEFSYSPSSSSQTNFSSSINSYYWYNVQMYIQGFYSDVQATLTWY